jgi:hypothetical protein
MSLTYVWNVLFKQDLNALQKKKNIDLALAHLDFCLTEDFAILRKVADQGGLRFQEC